tara:strand:+ start:20203 stop:20697 length:495 start_codon:yes stop_codon:yes gene_type:complete
MPEGMIARLDALGVVKSDFARVAVLEKLDAGTAPITAADVRRWRAEQLEPNALLADLPMEFVDGDGYCYEARTELPAAMTTGELDGVGGAPDLPPDPKKNSLQGSADKLTVDQKVILSALREKSRSSRDLEKRLAWLGLRYSNAEKSLLGRGLIAVVGGMLVAT